MSGLVGVPRSSSPDDDSGLRGRWSADYADYAESLISIQGSPRLAVMLIRMVRVFCASESSAIDCMANVAVKTLRGGRIWHAQTRDLRT